jgi:hypothetical protein
MKTSLAVIFALFGASNALRVDETPIDLAPAFLA